MRLARCLFNGETRSALIEGERAHILADDLPFVQLLSMSEADLKCGSIGSVSRDELTYLPPVERPDKILCVGLNYRDHAAEAAMTAPPYPSLFPRFSSSQVGHLQPIIAPANSIEFDFEGELAFVIGRPCRHVGKRDAMKHVAGYCCFGENSVRDFQQHSRQITPGKNFVRSGSIGPWITTADEVGDPSKLSVITSLNGQEVQRGSLSELIYTIPDIITYVSSFTELLPGDIIATGTPAGVGARRDPPLWMKPGDTLEIDIPRVGRLINPVAGEAT